MAHVPEEPAAPQKPAEEFKPHVSAEESPKEFTVVAVLFGSLFGIIFGASTVYLALKAGLTVSASIPIAVIAISVLRVFKSTILENNIVQTIGSAGESVAAGVAFTVPALLFLSTDETTGKSVGEPYFDYLTIMTLAACGGILGVLIMVPLRRSLIVAEHQTLPYPEGTACADVLVAGEKGGRMAAFVFGGVFFAIAYQILNVIFAFWKETASWVSGKIWVASEAFSTANPLGLGYVRAATTVSPEYLGVGYILGPRIGGIMVSGGILTFCVFIPLLAFVLGDAELARRLGMSGDQFAKAIESSGGRVAVVDLVRGTYTRYIGAGAVTMAGIITLIKTLPTILRSLKESFSALRRGAEGGGKRTERDIPITWVALGSLGLAAILVLLPIIPGDFKGKCLMAGLMLVFGFLFVTVSSRIVGLIGSSSNPISGMTIATLLGTASVFMAMGMGGKSYEAIALCVGAIVCIAAANAGATSQDLKTGFLVGATPIRQQVGLVIGVVVSTIVIGLTLKFVDGSMRADGFEHAIGTWKYEAPQANLMATVIKGVMSQNLPWAYIFIGAASSLMAYLAGVSPLAWAVGVYLPINTTLPIFIGGLVRALSDKVRGEKGESEIAPGMLFATGLVAGGTLTGVASSVLTAIPRDVPSHAPPGTKEWHLLKDCQHHGEEFQKDLEKVNGVDPNLWAMAPYAVMILILFTIAMRKAKKAE